MVLLLIVLTLSSVLGQENNTFDPIVGQSLQPHHHPGGQHHQNPGHHHQSPMHHQINQINHQSHLHQQQQQHHHQQHPHLQPPHHHPQARQHGHQHDHGHHQHQPFHHVHQHHLVGMAAPPELFHEDEMSTASGVAGVDVLGVPPPKNVADQPSNQDPQFRSVEMGAQPVFVRQGNPESFDSLMINQRSAEGQHPQQRISGHLADLDAQLRREIQSLNPAITDDGTINPGIAKGERIFENQHNMEVDRRNKGLETPGPAHLQRKEFAFVDENGRFFNGQPVFVEGQLISNEPGQQRTLSLLTGGNRGGLLNNGRGISSGLINNLANRGQAFPNRGVQGFNNNNQGLGLNQGQLLPNRPLQTFGQGQVAGQSQVFPNRGQTFVVTPFNQGGFNHPQQHFQQNWQTGGGGFGNGGAFHTNQGNI